MKDSRGSSSALSRFLSLLFRFSRRRIPWMVVDAVVVAGSLAAGMVGRSVTADIVIRRSFSFGLVAIAVYLSLNYAFRLYHRMWRYASSGEVTAIGASVASGTLCLFLLDMVWPSERAVPLSVVLVTGFFAFGGFVGVRYRRRLWTGFGWRWRALGGQFPVYRARVMVVGAGEAGQLLAWRLLHQQEGKGYRLIGFVDDDPAKQDMRLHGAPVLGDRNAIPQLVLAHEVELIIIAMFNISGDDFRAILDICEQTPVVIKVLPSVFEFIRGAKSQPPIRDIGAEDLLGRKPVEIDRAACHGLLVDKMVMVTGAAGSIGSELCRQIATFGPRQLLMLDNNESGLYDLVIALGSAGPECLLPIVGDTTNEAKMRAIFDCHRPDIVFHAAAYKHVPLMEEYPEEAIRVNVLGTRIVAGLAACYGAERFVLVSTDKAVNPSSVMGATKRICELLISDLIPHYEMSKPVDLWAQVDRDGGNGSDHGVSVLAAIGKPPTVFTAVRFGNVLGSRGSVVPTFERQIEHGGPVTITHPDMTRYFMSISEAASLIIQAAALTEGDDVFMLDMGQQIRIDDLARRIIRLRGLRPEVDIPIVYTGTRPGEKMEEELFSQDEERFATSHPLIFRVRAKEGGERAITRAQIDDLVEIASTQSRSEAVARLRALVAFS